VNIELDETNTAKQSVKKALSGEKEKEEKKKGETVKRKLKVIPRKQPLLSAIKETEAEKETEAKKEEPKKEEPKAEPKAVEEKKAPVTKLKRVLKLSK